MLFYNIAEIGYDNSEVLQIVLCNPEPMPVLQVKKKFVCPLNFKKNHLVLCNYIHKLLKKEDKPLIPEGHFYYLSWHH